MPSRPRMTGSVHVIGAGLIGASIGMALQAQGVRVTLEDLSPTTAALARDLGAGSLPAPAAEAAGSVDIVVVATPPDVTSDVVVAAQRRFPAAIVTDVASVKGIIVDEVGVRGGDLARFVGGHPMAGRERSGAISARGDLFEGRAWVLTPTSETTSTALTAIRRLAESAGAAVVVLGADEHDEAVASVSHVPQIAASVVAARLEHLSDTSAALAGQGVRDVTRIAASDPGLWTQILVGNAPAVRRVLMEVIADLQDLQEALGAIARDGSHDLGAPGSRAVIAGRLAAGNAGHARIPGKHGSAPTAYGSVTVFVPDEPGQLGRLFNDVGAAGVNLEDLRLDHAQGQPFGLAEIFVVPGAVGHLTEALTERGWRLHG
ncbi:prephenate dehydrogenase [Nostocoides sp. F2B08]|uniref:prephenate dehydrogenase n=1 Tax=Nostocoides sp. F2B08 TaxID=2653936 RepID=UPI001D038A01|nr:prephenate dehydrogenase [Tetrasphaera sp. F2B08]